jgi:hypothetical protein
MRISFERSAGAGAGKWAPAWRQGRALVECLSGIASRLVAPFFEAAAVPKRRNVSGQRRVELSVCSMDSCLEKAEPDPAALKFHCKPWFVASMKQVPGKHLL